MKTRKTRYSVENSLIDLLISITSHNKQEIWVNLANMANVCIEQITKKNSLNSHSHTTKTYPGTKLKVKITVDKYGARNFFYVAISIVSGGNYESFTCEQIEEYLEGILFGEWC